MAHSVGRRSMLEALFLHLFQHIQQQLRTLVGEFRIVDAVIHLDDRNARFEILLDGKANSRPLVSRDPASAL